MNLTKEIRCCHKNCRKIVKLSKSDKLNQESSERMGFGFGKLCKKHEREIVRNCK